MSFPPWAAPALVLLLAVACRGSSAPSPAPANAADAADVVARVDGSPIRGDELDQRVEKRLARVRQEEYEIRRQALQEMIGERLVEAEAKRRGLSREELLRDAVENQVLEPEPALVEQIYGQNEARFGSRTKDEAVSEIRRVLRDRARAERRSAFQAQLREKAEVVVALAAPRTDMPVPASAPALGPAGAPVTIVEFSDYQCPYCHRAQSTIDQVMSAYAGKVQLVHRDFPLDMHPQAFAAARASRCAGEQGRFWDYHRSLMTVPGPMDDADLRSRAAGFRLDAAAFAACLSSDRHDSAIRESFDAGAEAGVTGTPAYFVNGRLISGAQPFEAFREVIDSELERAGRAGD